MKYLKFLALSIRLSAKSFSIYRTTALLTIAFGILFYIVELLSGIVLFQIKPNIAGYSLYDYLLLVSVAALISNLYMTLFIVSHEMLWESILEGDLDGALIRPLPSLFYYSFYRMDLSVLLNVIMTIPVMIYLYAQYETFSLLGTLGFILCIALGVLCLYTINQIVVSMCFWIEKGNALLGTTEYLFNGVASKPMGIYPRGIMLFLSYALPFGIITNELWLMPIQGLQLRPIIILVIWNSCAFVFVRILWNKGLKRYASAN